MNCTEKIYQKKNNNHEVWNNTGFAYNNNDITHWREIKTPFETEVKEVEDWISVDDKLPNDEINVLCLHSFSDNYFICYRTKDCLTNEPKWWGGAKPTH